MLLAFVRRHYIYNILIKETANDVTFKQDSELNWQNLNYSKKHIRLKSEEIARKWLY